MKKHIEFSKLILLGVMSCFFLGAGVGICLVLQNPELLGELLAYIGAPVAVAIGFYSWKAKAENLLKLNKKDIEKVSRIIE